MRRAISSFSLTLSFVLLFLLAQAWAAAHEFSHLNEDAGEEAEVCVFCLAAAALGSAVSLPEAPDLGLPPLPVAVFALPCISCFSTPCRAYWGRAPPLRARLR